MWWPFRKRAEPETETRSSGNFTSMMLDLRAASLVGGSGVAELSSAVQSAVTIWESGLSLAAVSGTTFLTPGVLGIAARQLALTGESLWYITELGLLPVADHDLSTRGGRPRAYRISVPEISGAESITALAAEVLHFRVGASASAPWQGTSPLRRSSLSADLLAAVESALSETFDSAPIGSQIVSFPESSDPDLQKMGASFKGKRGRVLMQESTNVHAAGGVAPVSDWTPRNLTPDLSKSMSVESLAAARNAILSAYGILPAMFSPSVQGNAIRECQRHVAQWQLMPMCAMIGAEAGEKLGTPVTLDVVQPTQSWDAGGRARAAAAVVSLLAEAKEAGVNADDALKLVNWEQ